MTIFEFYRIGYSYYSLKVIGIVYLTRTGLLRCNPGFHFGIDWTTRRAS